MKRLLLAIALCSFPLAVRAQDDAVQDNPVPAPATDPVPAVPAPAPKAGLTGAFDWKLRLQPGQKWEVRTYLRMTQTHEFPPAAQADAPPAEQMPPHVQVQMMQRSMFDYEVLALDKFGASTVKLTYREILNDTNTTADGKPYPDEKAAHQKVFLTGLEGASITFKQAADGTVWNVYGADKLPALILKSVRDLPAEEVAKAQEVVNQFGSDQYWRRFFQALSGALPKYPVIVSESWNYDVSAPLGVPLQISYTGKRILKTRKDGIASIQEEANIDSAGFEADNGPGKVAIKDYKGTITGASQINEATGLPQSSNLTYKIAGTVQVDVPVKDGEPKKMDSAFTVNGESHLVMERKN